jgi:RimJ/RimL family protein N-acetyltransferase
MFEALPMNEQEASKLDEMMHKESSAYVKYFTAFSESGELLRQSTAAKADAFFSLKFNNNLAGFFCLRGFDEGYERPSFGVYVASQFSGNGLAGFALDKALEWCRKQKVKSVMLKVSEFNESARHLYEKRGFKMIGLCPSTGHLMMEGVIN